MSHTTSQVEQAVATLQPLPRYQQTKVIAQMVFDGALTAAQGKDVLFVLCAVELGAPIEEPSTWRRAFERHNGHS